jgi:hypothetical protein
MPKCKIEWCERPVFSKHLGLCKPHYQQAYQDARRRGVPIAQGKPRADMPLRGSLRGVAICTQLGCDQLVWHEKTQLCEHHYWRQRRYGDPNAPLQHDPDRGCVIHGCTRPHKGHGLCRFHLRRKRADAEWRGVAFEQGDPLAVWVVREPGRRCTAPGCDNPYSAKGLCRIHYLRKYGRGGDVTERRRAEAGAPERFLESAFKHNSDECLFWPYSTKGGYARISLNHGIGQNVCRIICQRVYGLAPTNKHEAAHSCGNGHVGCINPRHLRWATPKENGADKKRHGTGPRGARSAFNKVSEDQVRTIVSLEGRMSRKELADHFNVHCTTVDAILSGKSWGWLTGRVPEKRMKRATTSHAHAN